ncbi:hypothetical protein ACOMHN_015009 [Nucella lapillus]
MASPRSLTLTNSSEELVEAVRQSKWKEAITLLPRLDCASQHRQEALREILKKAPSVLVEVRLQDILSNCTDELLGDVFSCLVERSLWKGVGRMMRKNLCSVQHTWAVKKAIRLDQEIGLCMEIVPHCAEEHLEQILRHAVLRKQWCLVDTVLERGVRIPLRKWAVQEALNRADEDDFATFLLHHFSEEDLELVSTHMVTHGLWKPEDDVTHTGSIAHILSQIVSRGLWKAVGKFLQRDVGSEQHAWAVGQASTHADDDRFLFDILPQCSVEELEGVMTQLVSRCMWWSVNSALGQGVSTAQCTWTVDTALKHASEEDFATLILPHCTEDELGHVVSHMVSQGLWIPVDSVTECEVSVTQHILSQLVSRGLWESVAVVLERYKNTPLHQWAICEAAKHVADETFDCVFLSHCSEDDIVAVFPVLVANKKLEVVKRVLYDMVCKTLNSWITPEQESRNPDTLFWKFIDSCRVDVSLALGLTKAVIQETPRRIDDSSIFQTSSDLAEQVAWQRPLCEALVRTLLHTLCFAVCSGGGEYTDSAEHTK